MARCVWSTTGQCWLRDGTAVVGILWCDGQVSVRKVNDDILIPSGSYLGNEHYQHTAPTCQNGQKRSNTHAQVIPASALPPRPSVRKHVSERADTTVDMPECLGDPCLRGTCMGSRNLLVQLLSSAVASMACRGRKRRKNRNNSSTS